MALNKAALRTRTLTAIVFVAVMASGLFYSKWSFFILFSVVHFGAWREYVALIKKWQPALIETKNSWWATVALLGWCGMLYATNHQLVVKFFSLKEGGFWLGLMLFIALPVLLLLQRQLAFKAGSFALLGLIYISLPLSLLIDLRTRWTDEDSPLNFTVPLLLIFTLWVNDTMAYIVGSLIGKTPLSPVSPKKTWEGTVGGALLAVMVITALAHFTERLSPIHAAAMSFLAASFGTIGDLAESRLKRLAGVKDSGTIMPGHGGFLDRFDSLLFAVVVVWLWAAVGL